MLVSLVQEIAGSLDSVIAITPRLSSLNLGPKRSKEQAQMRRNLKKREREEKKS